MIYCSTLKLTKKHYIQPTESCFICSSTRERSRRSSRALCVNIYASKDYWPFRPRSCARMPSLDEPCSTEQKAINEALTCGWVGFRIKLPKKQYRGKVNSKKRYWDRRSVDGMNIPGDWQTPSPGPRTVLPFVGASHIERQEQYHYSPRHLLRRLAITGMSRFIRSKPCRPITPLHNYFFAALVVEGFTKFRLQRSLSSTSLVASDYRAAIESLWAN